MTDSRLQPAYGDGDTLAQACAEEAHLHHFSSHFGVLCVQDEDDPDDEGVLVIYNNHPYATYPLLRDEELAEIRSRLLAEGIPERGFATYPQGGPADGYSYAMVLGVSEDWWDFVEELVNEAMAVCWKRHGG